MNFKMPKISKPKILDKWLGTGKVKRKHLNIPQDIGKQKTALIAKATHHYKTRGWVILSCDAMLHQGKYAAVTGFGSLEIAEDPKQPGRYYRRPYDLPCWKDGQDLGSKTTWSRDMGVGFIWWAYRNLDFVALGRHIEYGRKNLWVMGEPLADGRTIYTPNMIALLYAAYGSLVKQSYKETSIGGIYSSGLTDYEAHLTVLSILLRGEIDGYIWQRDLKIIEEQAERQPKAALYQSARAVYGGSLSAAVSACLNPEPADYISRQEPDICHLIDVIFALDLLERAGK
jgi:hypothetical protein